MKVSPKRREVMVFGSRLLTIVAVAASSGFSSGNESVKLDAPDLHVVAVKTSIDRVTGDYEALLLVRISVPDRPRNDITLSANVQNAGMKGQHGVWCFNEKLARMCAREKRVEIFRADDFLHLPEGYIRDVAWTARVKRNAKPSITVTVMQDAAVVKSVAVTIDSAQGARWYVASQRYVQNGDQSITLPTASQAIASGYVQFVSYGCLSQDSSPVMVGVVQSGDVAYDVEAEQSRGEQGCKWWVTKPIYLNPASWVFTPSSLHGFVHESTTFEVYQNPNPYSDPWYNNPTGLR